MRNGLSGKKAKRALRQAAFSVESLEGRTLLSTSATAISNLPTYTPTTTTLTDTKNGPLGNTSQNLAQVYLQYRHFRSGGGTSSAFSSSYASSLEISGDRVAVTVRGRAGITALTNTLHTLGGQIIARDKADAAIDVWLPIANLHSLAVTSGVATVNAVYRPVYNQQGIADNAANELEQIDTARTTFGLDGQGVKIGVLSNSVNQFEQGLADSIATGDLPGGVQVLQDGEPGEDDEGRGILELVHDLAPSASLAFATADATQLNFAQNIRALHAAGANVLVDDVLYPAEPVYEPGVIEDAINDVTADGATYFSSAGNISNSGLESAAAYVTSGGVRDIDFDTATSAQDNRLTFTVGSSGTLLLQWDNPYNGVAGDATTDFDLYVYNSARPNRVEYSATTNNLASGIPLEDLDINTPGTYTMEIRVAGRAPGAALPTRFKLSYIGSGETDDFRTEYSNSTNDSAIFGHAGGPNVISVGAVDADDVTDFNNATSTVLDNEDFSSYGPVVRVFDANGKRLARPLTINKPDVSGVDDVTTSFFPSEPTGATQLPTFSGTSAAAPDVAAIAALIYQANPTATSSQIRQALIASAQPLNGAAAGRYNVQGGYGLVDATTAVSQFVRNPTVQIVSSATSASAIDSVKIVFSQQVSNFDVSDLTLSMDGSENLLSGANSPTTIDGGRTFTVPGLAAITTTPGTYTLTLNDVTGITNVIGLALSGGATNNFVIATPDLPDRPSALSIKTLSDTALLIRFADNSENETGFTLQRATSSDFTTGLKNIHINLAGQRSIQDSGLSPSTTYFYRVRASNVAGNSAFSASSSGMTLATGEIILDNESTSGVTVKGSFTTASSVPGFLGSSYLDDGNTGKGTKSVTYTPNIESAGDYYVYIRYTSAANRATNVPVTITNAKGKRTTVLVNERKNGGGYVLLGKFALDAGTGQSVTIGTTDTNGHVIADAVRFLPTSAG